MSRARNQRGLTLIELLVAMGVFAVVSAASVGVLTLAVSGQEQLAGSADQTTRLERARALIRADLAQVARRPVREAGVRGQAEALPAFMGGDPFGQGRTGRRARAGEDDARLLFAVTRAGWSNPGDARPRPTLQRAEYLMREGALVRRTRPYLDAAQATPRAEQVLLEGLEEVSAEFLVAGAWIDVAAGGDLPLAVRIQMTHPGLGPLTQDFLVGPR